MKVYVIEISWDYSYDSGYDILTEGYTSIDKALEKCEQLCSEELKSYDDPNVSIQDCELGSCLYDNKSEEEIFYATLNPIDIKDE